MELLALNLKLVTFSSACKKYDDDEPLPNFIKREHPRKRERKGKKGQGSKSMQANNLKEVGHTEVMESLSTETSTSRMKHIN